MINKWNPEGSREEIQYYVQILFHLANFPVIRSFFYVLLFVGTMLGSTK